MKFQRQALTSTRGFLERQWQATSAPIKPCASGRRWWPDARSAVKHRPADVIPQPLVVKYELANRFRELVTLPLALE
jgi:hypothetical protein